MRASQSQGVKPPQDSFKLNRGLNMKERHIWFVLVLITIGALVFFTSGCTKVDELLNGKDAIEVQYPGLDEVVIPPPLTDDDL